ncbi:hypothetical protein C8Q73DRAFT_174190 [Cubamyces lactineus]|nr:hypothetical protein C8Q73DRAFT_174190 [Cubamyces lactineus]
MTRTTRFLLSQRYGMKKRAKDKPMPSAENQPGITEEIASSNSSVQGPSHSATAKTTKNPMLGNVFLPRQSTLPVEVLETILREAWVSTPIHRAITRWGLFQAVRGVNRQWREVMLQVAIRNVVVHWASDADLAGYLLIGLIASGRYGHLDSNSKQSLANASEPSDTAVGAAVGRLRIPSKDILQDIFRRSSIFVHLQQPPSSMEARSWKTYARSLVKERELQNLFPLDFPLQHQQQPPLSTYLLRLSRVIPNAKRVSMSFIGDKTADAICMSNILLFVDLLPSATDLHFYGRYQLPAHDLKEALTQLPPSMRNVRYLHFEEYPVCARWGHTCGQVLGECYIAPFMAAFKNVEHLRIDSPTILKCMMPLHALHTLTLAVPLVTSPAAHAHNSIVGYNIPTALKHGLFRGQLAAGKTPRIICITGEVEPVGWDSAQAACSRRGVVLIRKRDSIHS